MNVVVVDREAETVLGSSESFVCVGVANMLTTNQRDREKIEKMEIEHALNLFVNNTMEADWHTQKWPSPQMTCIMNSQSVKYVTAGLCLVVHETKAQT